LSAQRGADGRNDVLTGLEVAVLEGDLAVTLDLFSLIPGGV
jgi:hypothetical protein